MLQLYWKTKIKEAFQLEKKFRIAMTLLVIAFCLFFFASCGPTPTEGKSGNTEQTPSQTNNGGNSEEPTPSPSVPETESPASPSPDQSMNDVIEKITGAADEGGIYTIIITLSDKAAEKGTIEMVYYGEKGSPQENSVVNTFRIEYEKTDGLFEIHTFSDGKVYMNQHKQSKVKVNNTFSAALRAGNVIIYYAPDGEQAQKIYRADAEQFFVPTK